MPPATTVPTIELSKICFGYATDKTPLFTDLNFSLRNERIGLIGDNGSGKTTLLHLMVGLIKPHSGHILFKGQPLIHEKDFTPMRKQVGMLFQNVDDQLFSPSVLEDVAFGPLNQGYSSAEARQRALETLTLVGMEKYPQRITHHLSGGEKRLVALATILAMQPKVLLLDEPTNDLDQEARKRLLTILDNLNLAMILISHDWDFLACLTDHYYGLEHGHLHRSDRIQVHQHHHGHPLGDQAHSHPHE